MKKVKTELFYYKYDSIHQLDTLDKTLVKKAKEALALSYSPYSNFQVGAALATEKENIILGANQENASYPLCLCAERVALNNWAIQAPHEKIITLAVTARNPLKQILSPISPCGACRQVISEYEQRQNHPIRILLFADGEEIFVYESIKSLLPFVFTKDYLP